MEQLNIVQIEEKIVNEMKNVRSQEDLVKLQKWARKAKKHVVVAPTVTSFKQMNYWYETPVRSQGSGKFLYRKSNNVSYTSFVFLGIEIRLPQSDVKYSFDDSTFTSHKIWVDRQIKYGGVEYFPTTYISDMFGINFEKTFFEHIKEKGFFIVNKNDKTFYLCNSESNAKKILVGRRLTQFDLCNNPVVKISKAHIDYLKLEVKDWDSLHPQSNNIEFNFIF